MLLVRQQVQNRPPPKRKTALQHRVAPRPRPHAAARAAAHGGGERRPHALPLGRTGAARARVRVRGEGAHPTQNQNPLLVHVLHGAPDIRPVSGLRYARRHLLRALRLPRPLHPAPAQLPRGRRSPPLADAVPRRPAAVVSDQAPEERGLRPRHRMQHGVARATAERSLHVEGETLPLTC